MAHFYADIQGNRGPVSRLGSKNSGIGGHIRGWGIGVEVNCYFDELTGRDVCKVSATGGSNGRKPSKHIATVTVADDGSLLVS
jgi:hypothetical protein